MKLFTTQIAATPTIRGKEARKIWEEAHRMPSKASEEGAQKLEEFFGKKTIIWD